MAERFVIDRLWQGVSGQAPWQRKRGMVSSAKNVRFDLRVGGAVKRNPLELVLDLEAHASGSFDPAIPRLWGSIRGAIVAIAPGGDSDNDVVVGWDKNGVPLEVLTSDGGPLVGSSFDDYLSAISSPLDDLDVTVERNVMVVANRLQAMNMTADSQRGYTYDQSYNYIRTGDPDSTEHSSTHDFANARVSFFSDLQDEDPVDGEVWIVFFDENLDPAGRYIYIDPDVSDGGEHEDYPDGFFPQHGRWYRIPPQDKDGDGQPRASFDESKMPHQIVYDEDAGTLTVGPPAWKHRISGNQGTAKQMPWRTHTDHIKAVEFFSGRLFIFSESHITSSRHDDFFNLWPDNVNALTDEDRIMEHVTQTHAGEILRAQQAGGAILVLTENAQIEFSSGDDPLTNVNGRVRMITDYPSVDLPPGSGPGLATFADKMGDVHQYTWGTFEPKALMYTGMLTAHVPDYFGNKTFSRLFMIGMTVYVLLDGDAPELHDTFFLEGKPVQSAWSTFETTDEMLFVSQWDGNIRMITYDDTSDGGYTLSHYQHRLAPAPAGMLYLPRMDRLELVALSDMVYDPDTDETTIPHSGREGDADTSFLVTTDADNNHEFIKADRIDDSGNPVFNGDVGSVDSDEEATVQQYLGFVYDSEVTLTELYPDITTLTRQMQGFNVFHYQTTDYVIEWKTHPGSQTYYKRYQSHRVGVSRVGAASFETRFLELGVIADPRVAEITMKSSTPGQFAWMAIEYVLQPQGGGKG